MSRPNTRELALQIIRRWDGGEVYAETLIEKAVREHQLSSEDRAFLTNLVMSVLRHRNLLTTWIRRMRDGKVNADTKRILEIGLAQVLLHRVAPHAAVNETVELAKHRGTHGLINAILRRADRERVKLEKLRETLPPNSKYSTPLWLIQRWNAAFGKERTLALLEWNQQIPKHHVRINPLKSGDLPTGLTAHPKVPAHFTCDAGLPMAQIDAGELYVTDPSTAHAVALLAPQAEESHLDACAAPGGKAANIAAQLNNQGTLVATDSEPHRLPRLQENLARLGVTCAQVQAHDWTQPCPEAWLERFDGVLLDVPCSNTGVMQRRVDVRWRLTPEEFSRITALQSTLLENASAAVKVGGRLVYSTCSIDPEENAQRIDAFLAKHPNWSKEDEKFCFPPEAQHDGAYAARLRRIS